MLSWEIGEHHLPRAGGVLDQTAAYKFALHANAVWLTLKEISSKKFKLTDLADNPVRMRFAEELIKLRRTIIDERG